VPLAVSHSEALTLERLPSLDAAHADWDRLAPLTANVFSTYEWADAWVRHMAEGSELVIAACRRPDGEVAAILPLAVTRRAGLRVLRFIGHGPADQLGPICAPADRPEATLAFRRLVRKELGGRGLCVAERLWGDDAIAPGLGGFLLRREASPVVRVEGRTFDEYLASRSKNFRDQVRRRERKLRREHEVVVRLTEDPARLDADMETLLGLHAARWAGEDETTAFAGPRRPFHLQFARSALERGWLRLWVMEIDGRPVAAWHGFRYEGIDHYYQAGRDPELDAQNVGFVLLAHSVRDAFDDGSSEYRLGLGDEGYKGRFAGDDPGLDTVVFAQGAGGRAAIAAMRLGLRIPVSARHRARQLVRPGRA
jgi:CelD/BcsL family acetyltransferase involved in cellulose biosynthesis